jgi:hypothetical protein
MNQRFAKGTTIRIIAQVTDYEDNYVDPDTIEVMIIRGSTTILAYTSMVKDDVGKYYYRWQSQTSDPKGKYEVKVRADRNSYTSIEHDERAFYLY